MSYYLGDRLVAQREVSTLRYVHQDHLTGTSVISDPSGNLLGAIGFYAFGSTRSGAVPTDIKFTGQRLDDSGLYYYGARYYDPAIGRFISPDSIVSRLTNPQAFNRYSYAINNPLKYTDPTGHDWREDPEMGWVNDPDDDPSDDAGPPGTINPITNPVEVGSPPPSLPTERPAPVSVVSPGPSIPTTPPQPQIPQPLAPAQPDHFGRAPRYGGGSGLPHLQSVVGLRPPGLRE